MKGKIDVEKNKIIEELSEYSFHSIQPSIYRFDNKQRIIFHPIWLNYLNIHIGIIESFLLWHLVRYLERRNPNVQNIANKIMPPQKRDLSSAHKFWNVVLQYKSVECIYSSEMLNYGSDISIDHFIPWAFVAHDYLWNLCPTTRNVNSSKSDNIPKIDLYLPKFTKNQYIAFNIVFASTNAKLLEDYIILFQDSLQNIANFSENEFRTKLEKQIIPLSEIANNLGFNSNWVY